LVTVVRAHDRHPSRAFGCAGGIKFGHGHAPLLDISVVIERDCVWSSVIPNAFKKDTRAGLSVGDLRLMDVEAVCVIVEGKRSKGSGHDRVIE
jgi:hypothetical protein